MGAPLLGPQIQLENLRVHDTKVLGTYSSGALRVSAHDRFVSGQTRMLAVEFMTYVLARKMVGDKQELKVRYPATWWQHLKMSHAPEWVKRRWPVRWTEHRASVTFTRYDTYPSADVPLPAEFGAPVTWDTIAFDGPLLNGDADSPCTVFRLDGEVSPGRRFLSKKALQADLVSLAYRWIHENYQPFFAENGQEGRNPPPALVVEAVIEALEAMGLNPAALVQQQQADQARTR